MNTQNDDIKSVLRWYPDFAKERREGVPTETPERQDRFNAIDVEGGPDKEESNDG